MIARRLLLLAAALALIAPCSAQSRDECAPPEAPPEMHRARVEVRPGGSIESRGSLVRAQGGVLLVSGKFRLSASDVLFDSRTRLGTMTDVVFTTCDKPNPDYRFVARKLSLLPRNRIHARGASLYVGRFKVITLPSIKMAIGQRRTATDQFPRPGIDKDDGFGISQKFALIDTERLQVNADLRLTTKRGIEGEVDNVWGIDGDLVGLPGRFLTYESLESSVLRMPRYFGSEPEQLARLNTKGVSRLRQFGRFTIKQRTYDIRNTGLLVYRQPEVGLSYTPNAINLTRRDLDPRLRMYPQISGSWGQFRETPGSAALTGRWNVNIVGAANVLPLGRRMALQPVVAYSASKYSDGLSYSTSAFAVDGSRIFSDGSIVSLRYITRNQWGASPFLFDTIQIFREIQGAFQVRIGSNVLGFVAGFDADTGKTYDWEIMLGHHTDCIAGWFTYHSRLQRFMIDAALINL